WISPAARLIMDVGLPGHHHTVPAAGWVKRRLSGLSPRRAGGRPVPDILLPAAHPGRPGGRPLPAILVPADHPGAGLRDGQDDLRRPAEAAEPRLLKRVRQPL